MYQYILGKRPKAHLVGAELPVACGPGVLCNGQTEPERCAVLSLCPPHLASSFDIPWSQDTRPRQPLGAAHLATYPFSPWVWPSFSLAPPHDPWWFNSIVLEPGKEKQGNQINISHQDTGGDCNWAKWKQFLCSQHHSKSWVPRHMQNAV